MSPKQMENDKNLLTEIRNIVDVARQKAYSAINSAMVEAYWQIGMRIVEQEQRGNNRADYGTQLIKSLSADLTKEYGKGFFVNSLYYFRQFYLAFPGKLPTVWGNIDVVALQTASQRHKSGSPCLVSERSLRANVELSYT